MKEIVMVARRRPESGKGAARRIRRDGYIPATVYGPETVPFGVAVEERQFRSAMKGAAGTSIIDLDVDGTRNKVVLRDIQRDPITSRVIHVDFHAISMNKPIHVAVPIHLTGTPIGVKTDGGIMQVTMRELEISCLPSDIPERVDIDVTELHIGDSVHVGNLSIPNVRVLSDSQRTVAVIAAPTVVKEEVKAAAEEAEVAEAAEGEAPEAEAAAEDTGKEAKEAEAEGGKKRK